MGIPEEGKEKGAKIIVKSITVYIDIQISGAQRTRKFEPDYSYTKIHCN